MVAHLRADDLVIRDVGSLSREALRQTAAKQAWLLRRLRPRVAVSPTATATAAALAVVDQVPWHGGPQTVVELAAYRGDARLPCRVLAYRLPEEGVEQRRRHA